MKATPHHSDGTDTPSGFSSDHSIIRRQSWIYCQGLLQNDGKEASGCASGAIAVNGALQKNKGVKKQWKNGNARYADTSTKAPCQRILNVRNASSPRPIL